MPRKSQAILTPSTAALVMVLLPPRMRKNQAVVIPVTKSERHMHQFHGLSDEEKVSNSVSVNTIANVWIHNVRRDAVLKGVCE